MEKHSYPDFEVLSILIGKCVFHLKIDGYCLPHSQIYNKNVLSQMNIRTDNKSQPTMLLDIKAT